MSRKILIILGGVLIFIILFLHSPFIAPLEFLADYDTDLTEEFSNENFGKIKEGMSKEDVLAIMGEPFSREDSWDGCFHYSKGKSVERRIQRYGDINWRDVKVCFNKEDKVTFKSDQIFFN